MPYNCAHLPFSPSKMPNFATSHGPRCRKTDVHNGLLIIIFCFLSFSGIHHASLAVATFANSLGRSVHHGISRAVAAVVVDYKVLELPNVVVNGHSPLLVMVALRHIGRVSPVAVAHFILPVSILLFRRRDSENRLTS